MSAILAVARKEFRAFFDSPVAYVFLTILLGIVSFLFFFLYLFWSNEAELRDFFWLLPPLFTIFVPAVAMRLWAEERHRGTFEVLLTLPVAPWRLVLGKYLGALLFLTATLVLTFPVPLTVAILGDPDTGPIIGGYLGALLLAATYLAIGMAMSALTRSQIVAFLLGFLVLLGLFLIGSPVVLRYVPRFLKGTFEGLGLGAHFEGIRRGVVDTRDLVYYASLLLLALFVTALAVESQRWGRRGRSNAVVAVGLAVVLTGLVGFFSQRVYARWDLTEEEVYSVSDGTRRALRRLPDLVTLRFVRSGELPDQLIGLSRRIEDTLRDLEAVADGRIRIDGMEVGEDEEQRREAIATGVPEIRVDVVGSDRREQRPVFFGVAVSYGDRREVLPFVQTAEFLEYDLVAAILKVIRDRPLRLAFLASTASRDVSAEPRAEYGPIREALSKRYTVTTHDTSAGRAVPEDVAVLVVAGVEGLSERERYEVDQFLARGGKAAFLLDAVRVRDGLEGADRVDHGLGDVLARLGVRLEEDIVGDVSRATAQFQSVYGNVRQINMVQYALWPMLRKNFSDPSHPVVARLDGAVFPWASSITVEEAPEGAEIEVTPLLRTTPRGFRFPGPTYPLNPYALGEPKPEDVGQRVLAVAATGTYHSAFAGRTPPPPAGEAANAPPEDVERKTVEASLSEIRAIVVGDSDFLLRPWVQEHQANLAFFQNAVDWLAAEEDLISVRSRVARVRSLGEVSDRTKTLVRSLNLVGAVLLVALLGGLRAIQRRWARRRIREDLWA